ncbi:MAG: hypothetical protein CLLPBCKN_005077 [Chroococcidiopsis cubana SAG 39.79]|jgi:hypothetical protein|uniref:DUF975 domain-containing protein n=1 Tax=Chroococcidiopsis cubana SAG 39.79 TaxID=388085 RepID=A0AB37USX8_9CYAN|nr:MULTISPECIES: hypothetical protein [Chroococcidiopsis]MDZ4875657.1 hypothetical protein [Chroococcidiopsis cubana SAG 39.79]PSB63316.1 hypothetical protein C7B79_14405 [Chroococcidiopsis cubana CCALA 043]RUT14372.1 hypothetical protein DSM107010_04030 [Chroococcidiopsis cubana SAG 39.79]URD50145.1 DUF975 domain-containing protein [Chroococcidiopsis sp. CCNUC1]
MSQFSSSSSMQPLNVGNVVTAGVRLYRSHFKRYLRLALQAYLWVLVPIYGWAKFAAIAGLISRLAFGELVNQPESISTARNYIKSRTWSFFFVGLRVGIFVFLAYIGFAIAGTIIGTIAVLFLGFLLRLILGELGSTIAVGLVVVALLGSLLFGLIWLYSRWFISEVPLAVEESINGAQSISRSWNLTQTFIWRIQGIVLITFIVTFPILAVSSYIPQIFLLRLEQGSTAYTIVYLISWVLSFAGGILIMPFWQVIKAVVYYDLRTRREGLGLKLRDRDV